LIAAAAFSLVAASASAQEADDAGVVTFTFQTSQPSGAVMVALFDSQDAYEGGAPVRQALVPVDALAVDVRFEGLPAGDYAARAFHDLDGDGEMDVNPFGLPVDPYAFSNNAVGNMGPAGWDR